MDLTFQVPMQYCSLQHQTLLLSPVTSTTGCCCCFGSIPSFFQELFLQWSPVAYWAPTDLGSSPFSVLSFCLFTLFMGFSRQEVVCHSLLRWPPRVLSELSTMTHPALHGMAIVSFSYTSLWSMWSFWLVFCDCGFHSEGHGIAILASSLCPSIWEVMNRFKGLDLVDRVPEELWMEVLNTVQESVTKTSHKKKKCKKAKWFSEEAFQIAKRKQKAEEKGKDILNWMQVLEDTKER